MDAKLGAGRSRQAGWTRGALWRGLLLSLLATLAMAPPASAADGDSSCGKNGAFYCHESDPRQFRRCQDDQLFTFRCPESLHFSLASQTCDWPENADCGSGGPGGDHANEIEGENSWENINVAVSHNGPASGDKGQHGGDGVLQGSGKPWYRPDDVHPRAWQDINSLAEVPYDGPTAGGHSPGDSANPWLRQKTGDGRRPDNAVVSRPELDKVQWRSGSCNPSDCRLPACRCPGTTIPGGLTPERTPQMVMLTFDDEVSAANYGYFQRLFRPGRYNPNGCPVRGGLFVSGSGTDYDLVYPLYAMGMEVASHTLSHKFPHTWWASASYREYVDEVEGIRGALSSQAGVPRDAIQGFRVPFLQLGADNMYKALYDKGFLYDTSMFTGSVWEGSDPVWPFTLDYTVPEPFCQHGPCPTGQYPGLWEIPVQRWYGLDGHSCAMPDGCTASADAEEDVEFFRSNFKRYYHSNRAPFGIFIHARWFHTEHHLEALDRFIDELLELRDVYIVTPVQVIQWMKNPTALNDVANFGPWACEGSLKK